MSAGGREPLCCGCPGRRWRCRPCGYSAAIEGGDHRAGCIIGDIAVSVRQAATEFAEWSEQPVFPVKGKAPVAGFKWREWSSHHAEEIEAMPWGGVPPATAWR